MLKDYIQQNDKERQKGAVLIWVAAGMIAFLGFAALAIDVGFLMASRNELQNAADAGALAGARVLYNSDGTEVNEGANQVAYDTAIKNLSMNEAVEVNWEGGNTGDVQRGHWFFNDRWFKPNESLEPVDLWEISFDDLDKNENFINAIQVKTRREATPVIAFFARVFGIEGFTVTAEAVAYIGFTGELHPMEVDQPFAVCNTDIVDENGLYTCSYGRVIHSGKGEGGETGAWTSFDQGDEEEDICDSGAASAEKIKDLYGTGNQKICSGLNPEPIIFGKNMQTTNGADTSVYHKFLDCWDQHIEDNGYVPWNVTIPVIDCTESNQITKCARVVGAVNIDIVWVTPQGKGQIEIPTEMGDWSANGLNGDAAWDSFVEYFDLVDAELLHKKLYFLPNCTPHEPTGRSGGTNYGILAKIPSLVK